MIVKFEDDFELANLSKWEVNQTNGALIINSEYPAYGSYCTRAILNGTTTGQRAFGTTRFSPQYILSTRAYFDVAGGYPASGGYAIIGLQSDTWMNLAQLWITPLGKLSLFYVGERMDALIQFPLNKHVCVEILVIPGVNGQIHVYQDGVEVITVTADLSSVGTAIRAVQVGEIWSDSQTAHIIDFDQVKIADSYIGMEVALPGLPIPQTPPPPPLPQSFESGFETGNFTEWHPNEESVYATPPDTECLIVTRTTGVVRSGNYAYMAKCDTRLPNWQLGAKLWNWITDQVHAFYTTYVYLPFDYALRDRQEWDLFIQFKEQDAPIDTTWGLILKNYSQTYPGRPPLEIMLLRGGAIGPIDAWFKEGTSVEFPKGRWVKVVVEYKVHDTEGIIRVWQDDVLLFERINIDTKGSSGSPYVMWGLCCYPNVAAGYTHEGPDVLKVFFDDATITADYPITPPLVQLGFPTWIIPVVLFGLGVTYILVKN